MKVLHFFICFCFSTIAWTQKNEALFQEANQLYSEHKYDSCIEKYLQIIENQEVSSEVYFNLANAYYKKNEVANSILFYEKALKLSPNDKDIRNNLAFAERMRLDNITPLPENGVEKWWNKLLNIYKSTGWARQSLLCLWLFLASALLYYGVTKVWQKRLFFSLALSFLSVAVGSYFISNEVFKRDGRQKFGILFSKEIKTFSEPNAHTSVLFTLHEGTKVEIIETLNQWCKIRLADGRTGWIESEVMKII